MNAPKRIELDCKQVEALLQRVQEGCLQEGDYEIIKGLADTIAFLEQAVNDKSVSNARLLRMLFGHKTEKAVNILKGETSDGEAGDSPSDDDDRNGPGPTSAAPVSPKPRPKKKKRRGHGRKKAVDYTGANKEYIDHPDLKHGDPCPSCQTGKVYEQLVPGVMVRVKGDAPLRATVYERQKLRCNLCGQIFTAPLPEEAGETKYDETANAIIPLLKYGSGMPFYRLEKLQQDLGIPLSASTQWDQVEGLADQIHPVFRELIRQAAQGEVLYNDDTTMKILALIKDNRQKNRDERKGIFTTGVLSTVGGRTMALFFTGRQHAGENLADILVRRDGTKAPPIQMCDALSRNQPPEFETIMANCLAHARRKYVEVLVHFPDECRYVLETLGKVYQKDALAREQHMSPQERLQFHQTHSAPLMEGLHDWLNRQFDEALIEPNSTLGGAIKYMLKHWPKLTRFLTVAGAPLDNNLCERALKRAVLHRKNALFYKTEHGAWIGDMFMSLIHTCHLMKVNAFDYLVALQKNASRLFKEPARWMPWNFKDTLAELTTAESLS